MTRSDNDDSDALPWLRYVQPPESGLSGRVRIRLRLGSHRSVRVRPGPISLPGLPGLGPDPSPGQSEAYYRDRQLSRAGFNASNQGRGFKYWLGVASESRRACGLSPGLRLSEPDSESRAARCLATGSYENVWFRASALTGTGGTAGARAGCRPVPR